MKKFLASLYTWCWYFRSFFNVRPVDEQDKRIVMDMTDPISPKLTLGKNVSPNDIATFIVRTAINMDASQYIHALEATGHTDVAYRLGTLTTAKMEQVLNTMMEEATKPDNTEEKAALTDDVNEPLISPFHFSGISKQ